MNREHSLDEPKTVHCVICFEPGNREGEVLHIFSTNERAQDFMTHDPRSHVAYDYVLDFPERFEGAPQ